MRRSIGSGPAWSSSARAGGPRARDIPSSVRRRASRGCSCFRSWGSCTTSTSTGDCCPISSPSSASRSLGPDESSTPAARCWSRWRGRIAGSCPTTRCRPSFATPSWPPRTRTSGRTPVWNTGRSRGWCTRRRRTRLPPGGTASRSRLRFPQGGSTLTQQLVRGFFLQDRSSRENGAALFRNTVTSWVLSAILGVPTTNKLLRKLEEMRLALWLEDEMRRHFGSPEQAKREIFARATRRHGTTLRRPATRGPCAAATRSSLGAGPFRDEAPEQAIAERQAHVCGAAENGHGR